MGVILDPKRGENTRELACPVCKKVLGKIALGIRGYSATCPQCKTKAFGLARDDKHCSQCEFKGLKPRRIPKDEQLPKYCPDCLTRTANTEKICREGGVFWECLACGNQGTAEANHPIAVAVRQQTGIQAPEPCGAKLDKTSCPVCLEGVKKP